MWGRVFCFEAAMSRHTYAMGNTPLYVTKEEIMAMVVDEIQKADEFKHYARQNGWVVKRFPEKDCAVVARGVEEIRASWIGGHWNEGYYFIKGKLIKKVRNAAEARKLILDKPARR